MHSMILKAVDYEFTKDISQMLPNVPIFGQRIRIVRNDFFGIDTEFIVSRVTFVLSPDDSNVCIEVEASKSIA